MAYPPPVPPPTRIDSTPQVTNHPGDHNMMSSALTDIINELGPDPSSSYPSVAARLDAVDDWPIRRGCGLVSNMTVNTGQNLNFVFQAEAWDSDNYHAPNSQTVLIPNLLGGMYLIGLEVVAQGGGVNGVCDVILAAKGVAHHSIILVGTAYSIPLIVPTDLVSGSGIEASVTSGHSVPMTYQASLVVQRLSD